MRKVDRRKIPRIGREQMQATAFIQTTAHRGTENLPFFAKRKRAGERLQAVPAREKIKGRGSAPGHGRMSSTERLTGQGSGHSPKPRAVVVYGPSPGHLFLQRRAYRPDKEAGTARPGLLRGGKGLYVSSVIMLLGPPGPIPRRACCGRCVGRAACAAASRGSSESGA